MPELYLPENKTFDYDDVILVPEKCVVKSRSEVSVVATLGGREFALPIIPANMSTIVNEETCVWLAERDLFYVMHRFDVDAVEFTKTMQAKGFFSSISLGIKPADYEVVDRFVREGVTPEYVTVDVAHGDSDEVIRVVRYLKEHLPESFVIAGNLATVEGAVRLAEAGAGAVKTGIGGGFVCTSAPNTGFGSRGWQLAAVANVAEALKLNHPEVKVIADGGIRHYGDFAKSVAFGADMIMVGSLLAGYDESPGDIIEIDGEYKKAYFGSASEYQKCEKKPVEGRSEFMPYKGSMADGLQTIKENLQSSVSYAGGRELLDLRNVKYVLIKR